MSRRVVITGMGAITPIGNTVDEFWSNIKKGVVGIGPITQIDTTDYKAKLAAEGAQITKKGRCFCGIVPFWLSAFVLKHRLRKWHPRPTSCGRHPRHPV